MGFDLPFNPKSADDFDSSDQLPSRHPQSTFNFTNPKIPFSDGLPDENIDQSGSPEPYPIDSPTTQDSNRNEPDEERPYE